MAEACPSTADVFVEQQLDDRISELENLFDADAISWTGSVLFGVDDIVRAAVERRYKEGPKRERLVVILTTTGGYIEVVQRIAETFRKHYKLVEFVVPN